MPAGAGSTSPRRRDRRGVVAESWMTALAEGELRMEHSRSAVIVGREVGALDRVAPPQSRYDECVARF